MDFSADAASFVLKANAQDKLDIPFVPSPMIVVERMLQLAEVKKEDVLYDLGSGDGRIVIQAARRASFSSLTTI